MHTHHRLFPALLLAALLSAPARADGIDDYIKEMTIPQQLVILASSPDYHDVERLAIRISASSHTPYETYGRIYDPQRGLLQPCNEDGYSDRYFPRRYNHISDNTPLLSIEKSDAYPGLKPHLYILVACIADTPAEARTAVAHFKKWSPTAYAHRTTIYMGCMH